jgi:hypothetical protein
MTEREILIETLKSNEYTRLNEMTPEQKVLLESANEDGLVQYKYSGTWYNPQVTMGNAVIFLPDSVYRLNKNYED